MNAKFAENFFAEQCIVHAEIGITTRLEHLLENKVDENRKILSKT